MGAARPTVLDLPAAPAGPLARPATVFASADRAPASLACGMSRRVTRAVYPALSTAATSAAASTSSVRVTRAASVTRLTTAWAPGTLLSFFSTRATHEAQVIPPIARSIVPIGSGGAVSVPVLRGASVMSGLRSGDDDVAGLVYGGADVVVGQGGL